MSEITFYSTNNAWANNGLMIMAQKMHYGYESEIEVRYDKDSISFKSIVDKSITDFIAETMQTLASNGTYNISTAFKVLNNEEKLDSNYYFQNHPIKKGDAKKTENITDEERDCLKKKKYSDHKKKQQIWKMRMSYFGGRYGEDIYLKMGLNFKEQPLFKKLTSYEKGKNICPLCGMPSKTMEDVKEFYNPLFGEHHNNEIEGIGDTRKKAKICPKCTILSYFALFDYYIPFYRTKKGEIYLTIPNTVNLGILEKITGNLSTIDQYIDFRDGRCMSYRTNIKNLHTNSKSASLLALLHNIKNKYHRNEPQSLERDFFEEITEKDFKEITEWLFISKSRRIIQIKSDENVYRILEPFEDPKYNSDVYLVPHFLNTFSFDIFNENEVEKFFNGILTFDPKKIAEGLFRISKESMSNINRMRVEYLPNNSSPLYLFTERFLEKIMGESTMLEDNLRDACKSIGKTVGKGFREDVGMLTKFAYSSGPNEFKKALEDASFRLAKSSALDKNKSFYLDANNLEIIMNAINQDNFNDAKTYFVSFMSAYVLSENYRQRKQEK
ncbi:MAG: hypothetical protein FGO69_06280 [Methanobacterium sp.]|jgi:hypothetical protein|nr:MAG: hypothetical protein FGO69_06280 [Methanobacterium sp.]